jgi:branched-chain amino acid aminotransferase
MIGGETEVACLVDGVETDHLVVTDSAVVRGYGCFEAIRSYQGRLFRLGDHLDRLERSAAAMGISVPDRHLLTFWITKLTENQGTCVVRVILTAGGALPGVTEPGRCIVLRHGLPEPRDAVRLMPVVAPWHPAGRPWELAGIKTTSYAPNLAAGLVAREAGFDDALLMSDERIVLEGPTFSIGWVADGTVYTPSLRLGILESVTRRVLLELWPGITEVEAPLELVESADEVFAMSTIKEVTPVIALGTRSYSIGPVTRRLAQRLEAEIAVVSETH